MAATLMPREASKFITENSKDVTISTEGVVKTAKLIYDNMKGSDPTIHVNRWKLHELNVKTEDESAVNWVFLTDILNFSFWSNDPTTKYIVRYNGKEWTGYWALCAAINRALDEGVPITDPKYYVSITADQLAKIMRSDSDTPMPMLEERINVLHEAGKVLVEKYDGSFLSVVKKADKSAQKLLKLVTEEFVSLQDKAEFNGKTVNIFKRAQILIADIWACCGGKGFGEFTDIDSITMFADYRIPQVLAWFGAMQYSETLRQKLQNLQEFPNGSRIEVEIRGVSIWAVELIVEEVKKMAAAESKSLGEEGINAVMVDHYLWDYRREHVTETDVVPFHRTRSIYY